jgi:hypothetical protein
MPLCRQRSATLARKPHQQRAASADFTPRTTAWSLHCGEPIGIRPRALRRIEQANTSLLSNISPDSTRVWSGCLIPESRSRFSSDPTVLSYLEKGSEVTGVGAP